jgi:hypothetical protein
MNQLAQKGIGNVGGNGKKKKAAASLPLRRLKN